MGMRNQMMSWWLVATMLGTAAWAYGQPAARPDKDAYTLFNPTPRHLMRDMSTDRPDTTESPFTVDAGHVQVEMSLVDYVRNDDKGVRTDTISALSTNVKLGLLNNTDVQFVFTPYTRVEEEAGGGKETYDGFSDDTQVRLKINLWGNDGPHPSFGDTAFAIMPFIKFPTGSSDLTNDHVEGGVIFPLAVALPRGWDLGLMVEVDFVYDEADDDYGVEFVHSAALGHDVPGIDGLGFFVEYVGVAPSGLGESYRASANAGLTYAIHDNWVLDCGVSVGLTDNADDVGVFVGTSFRY